MRISSGRSMGMPLIRVCFSISSKQVVLVLLAVAVEVAVAVAVEVAVAVTVAVEVAVAMTVAVEVAVAVAAGVDVGVAALEPGSNKWESNQGDGRDDKEGDQTSRVNDDDIAVGESHKKA